MRCEKGFLTGVSYRSVKGLLKKFF